MTLEEFLALLATLADATTVEDIDAAIEQVTAGASELATAEGVDRDALLDALSQAGDITEALRNEQTARDEADAAHEQAIADRLSRITGPEDLSALDGLDDDTLAALGELAAAGLTAEQLAELAADPGGDDDDSDGDDGDGTGTGDEGGTGDGTGDGTGGVNASGAPRISGVNARRPRRAQPAATSTPAAARMTAAGDLIGIRAGTELSVDDPVPLHRAVMAGFRRLGSSSGVDVPIMSSSGRFTDGRRLRNGDAAHNSQVIQRAQRALVASGSLEALNASGGPCAPGITLYDQPVIGTAERPVRDGGMVMRMGADRGAISTMPIPTLAQVTAADDDGGITVWDDTAGHAVGDNTRTEKSVAVIECDPVSDPTEVVGIVKRLKYSEFRGRFFPESVEAWLSLLSTEHARVAETRELTVIGDGSTHVTMGAELSSTRDILRGLGKQAAQFRNRHRTPATFPLRVGLPAWLRDHLREDLAAAEASGSTDERLAYADAEIETFFGVRHLNLSWFLDGETGQVYGAQTAGADLAWKSTVIGYLYPDGSWLHPEDPELVIGMYRDHRYMDTNDVGFFAETFEATHFHGVESQRLVFTLDPNGQGYGPHAVSAS